MSPIPQLAIKKETYSTIGRVSVARILRYRDFYYRFGNVTNRVTLALQCSMDLANFTIRIAFPVIRRLIRVLQSAIFHRNLFLPSSLTKLFLATLRS